MVPRLFRVSVNDSKTCKEWKSNSPRLRVYMQKNKFQKKNRTNKRVKNKFKSRIAKGESRTCKRWINIRHTSWKCKPNLQSKVPKIFRSFVGFKVPLIGPFLLSCVLYVKVYDKASSLYNCQNGSGWKNIWDKN
jgi:hypothetical protein